jgi:uncharacterized protein YhbP (UPF0306 family)
MGRLADYPALQEFIHTEFAATIAVPIDTNGTLHAAALGFVYTPDPLRFYFVTGRDTEKCTLLKTQAEIPCAAVLGTVKDVAFTVQLRGTLREEEHPDPALMDRYYQKKGNRYDDIDDPANLCLVFTPTWARFTDYAKGYQHFMLEL